MSRMLFLTPAPKTGLMEDGRNRIRRGLAIDAERQMADAQCRVQQRPVARARSGRWKPMRVRTKTVWGLAAVGAVALAGACGGGDMSPSGGTPPPNTTITIASSGVVSPKNLVVSPGTQVTFVNN